MGYACLAQSATKRLTPLTANMFNIPNVLVSKRGYTQQHTNPMLKYALGYMHCKKYKPFKLFPY